MMSLTGFQKYGNTIAEDYPDDSECEEFAEVKALSEAKWSVEIKDNGRRSHINRSGSSSTQYYKNGTNLKSGTTSSTAIPSVIINILCRNNNGTPGDFSNKQLSFALIGGSLSSQDVKNFNSCLERLLDYLGAGIQ